MHRMAVPIAIGMVDALVSNTNIERCAVPIAIADDPGSEYKNSVSVRASVPAHTVFSSRLTLQLKPCNYFFLNFVLKKNMPKLYEYFGLIILFHSNEREPIHVHGKYGSFESKAEIIILNGKITEINISKVKGKAPLKDKELKKFKAIVNYYKDDIVHKWIEFFVMNKTVKSEIITEKID